MGSEDKNVMFISRNIQPLVETIESSQGLFRPKGPLTYVNEPGVNFINILHTRFLYESLFSSFSLVHFGFDESTKALSYEKCVRKTLMKLTPALFRGRD